MRVRALMKLQYPPSNPVVRLAGEVFDLEDDDHFRGEHRQEKRNAKGEVMLKNGIPIMDLISGAQMEEVDPSTPVGIYSPDDDGLPQPPKQFKNRQQVFEAEQKWQSAMKAKTHVLAGAIAAPTGGGSPMAGTLAANAGAEPSALADARANGPEAPNGVPTGPKPPAKK